MLLTTDLRSIVASGLTQVERDETRSVFIAPTVRLCGVVAPEDGVEDETDGLNKPEDSTRRSSVSVLGCVAAALLVVGRTADAAFPLGAAAGDSREAALAAVKT